MLQTSLQIEILRQGTTYESIQQLYDDRAIIQEKLKPYDELEFKIRFSTTVPYIDDTALMLNNRLQQEGIETWQGLNKYVYIDEDKKGFNLKWKYGNPFFTTVILSIIGVGIIALIAIVLWKLSKVVSYTTEVIKGIEEKHPDFFKNLFIILGIIGAGLIFYPIILSEEKNIKEPP